MTGPEHLRNSRCWRCLPVFLVCSNQYLLKVDKLMTGCAWGSECLSGLIPQRRYYSTNFWHTECSISDGCQNTLHCGVLHIALHSCRLVTVPMLTSRLPSDGTRSIRSGPWSSWWKNDLSNMTKSSRCCLGLDLNLITHQWKVHTYRSHLITYRTWRTCCLCLGAKYQKTGIV